LKRPPFVGLRVMSSIGNTEAYHRPIRAGGSQPGHIHIRLGRRMIPADLEIPDSHRICPTCMARVELGFSNSTRARNL